MVESRHGSEIFFGLVTPIGIDGDTVSKTLAQALDSVNYQSTTIRVIDQLTNIRDAKGNQLLPSKFKNELERYNTSIEKGDGFCQKMGSDALVALAIRIILELRKEKSLEALGQGYFQALERHAYILRSLKRPSEIDRLRKVYGDSFFVISAHVPRDKRRDKLSRELASSGLMFDPHRTRHQAEDLITKDAYALTPHGQNVEKAYAKADVFIDASGTQNEMAVQLNRFVDILFGYQFHTPTPDEQGMSLAHLAALRSSHHKRQVGAAITRPDGTLVGIGCNEVPRAMGGCYWQDGKPDHREFQTGLIASLEVRQEVLGDLLKRLCDVGWLQEEIADRFKENEKQFVEIANRKTILRDSRLMDALEFDRTIHAEMNAITDAARHGINIAGCTLYTTTFPCHNCARHIVAAGLSRVVYIIPFEKSLTNRLHEDAVGIDLPHDSGIGRVRFESFVGVSPDRYIPFFTMGKRTGEGQFWDQFAEWNRKTARPRLWKEQNLYNQDERAAFAWLSKNLYQNKLQWEGEERDE